MKKNIWILLILFLSGCGGGNSNGTVQERTGKYTPPSPTMASGELRPPAPPYIEE